MDDLDTFARSMAELRGNYGVCGECGEPFTSDSEQVRDRRFGVGVTVHRDCAHMGVCWGCRKALYASDSIDQFDIPEGRAPIHKACRLAANTRLNSELVLRDVRAAALRDSTANDLLLAQVEERTAGGQKVILVCRAGELQPLAHKLAAPGTTCTRVRGTSASIAWPDRRGTCLVLSFRRDCLRGRRSDAVFITSQVARHLGRNLYRWLTEEADTTADFVSVGHLDD